MKDTKQLGASKEAIQHHYDLSNEFYELWLDESMTYTAALFENDGSLRNAQDAKIDFFASFLNRNPDKKRICDIGCGWGGALERFTDIHGWGKGIGITLSAKQTDWIRKNIQSPNLEICLESWADHIPEEPYDGLISIEAFEAFAKPGLSKEEKAKVYRRFFEKCHSWLKPQGYFGLQCIVFGNSSEKDFDSFISKEIFPESVLPTFSEIFTASHLLFEPVLVKNDRQDYAQTLRLWLKRLKKNREKALDCVGEKTVIRYERYLRLCIYMFEEGTCDLLRVILKRIDSPRELI